MAGCILIEFEKMQVINRSPAYRNQYVHRRDSVSIAMLSEAEIAERVKLGLITSDPREEEFEETSCSGPVLSIRRMILQGSIANGIEP